MEELQQVAQTPLAPPSTLQEVFQQVLARDPRLAALEYLGQEYDWAWMRDVSDRLEAVLAAADLPPNAPVAIIATQDPALYAAFIGLVAHGRSMTMIYSFQSHEVIRRDIENLGVGAVIAAAQMWTAEPLAGASEAGAMAISLSSDGNVAIVNGVDRARASLRQMAEPGVELLTSGTTGPPKRHLLPYRVLKRTLIDFCYPPDRKASPGQPHPLIFPFANVGGVLNLTGAIAREQLLLLEPKFSIDRLLAFIERTRLPAYQVPPPGIKMLLDANVPVDAFAGVRYFNVGAGAVDPDHRRLFEQRYGVKILMSYGATEYAGAAAAMSAADLDQYGDAKFDAVGRPIPGVTIRIVDRETGEVLPPGVDHVGLVEVLQPAIDDNWIRSNDLGALDEDGFLYLKGRADAVINRGGFKVHPSVIEGAITQHPAVAAACVLGIADERLGMVPVAAVELKPGAELTEAELDAHLRKLLQSTYIPAAYRFVDTMPRTPTLKIQAGQIRALFT